jgi:hypothetical protein
MLNMILHHLSSEVSVSDTLSLILIQQINYTSLNGRSNFDNSEKETNLIL